MSIQTESYFQQKFNIQFNPAPSVDYSAKAFVFPGQGSSMPGMYKTELKRYTEFQEVFAAADKFSLALQLGKVSDYIENHENIAKDSLPFIRNLALFSSQVAMVRLLNQLQLQPQVLTSHSFGEYAAWTVAGVLSFEQMLEVVYQRDIVSPPVNTLGTLVALSANRNEFEKLEVPVPYTIANINTEQQVVLAVAQEDVKKLSDFLKKQRIAARPMESVGRPYHSQLMKNAQSEFRQWLQQKGYEPKSLQVDVLSSVNRKLYKKGTSLTPAELEVLLTEQLIQPVDFVAQSKILAELGYRSFVEIGGTSLCATFVKANIADKDVVATHAARFLGTSQERRKSKSHGSMDLANNRFFKLVSKYIGDITGYEVQDIMVTDSFQEDLQIDSIKKAEIVFRVLEESKLRADENISISQLHDVGDVVEYLEKISKLGLKGSSDVVQQNFQLMERFWQPAPKRGLSDPLSISAELNVELSSGKEFNLSGVAGFQKFSSTSGRKLLVLQVPCQDLFSESEAWLVSMLRNLAESLDSLSYSRSELLVILLSEDDSGLFRGMAAFLKSLAKEKANFQFKTVLNLDKRPASEVLTDARIEDSCLDIKYSEGQRWSLHFREIFVANQSLESKTLLSFGGTKGILFEVFQKFDRKQNCRLILCGRSASTDKTVQRAVKVLNKSFKHVDYVQCDLSDRKAVSELLNRLRDQVGSIDYVLNAAGVEVSKKFADQSDQEVHSQIHSKFPTLQNLLQAKDVFPAVQIFTFSSIVAHFGNDGQTAYSFTNAYLDKVPGVRHLHWPPMDSIGMTENPGILQTLRSMGVSMMTKQEAGPLFQAALLSGPTHQDLFFVDTKDFFLFEHRLRDGMVDRRSFGDIADPRHLRFVKSYDLKNDGYLRDHHIESTSVVPAAAGVAAFMTFGEAFFKVAPRVENFEIKNMIIVNDRENYCAITTQFLNGSELAMKVVSQVEHFGGLLKLPNSSDPARNLETTSAETPKERRYSQQVEMEEFYSVRSIDYGPKFQVIERAYYDQEKNVVAVGKAQPPYLTGVALNDYIAYLVELGFQAIYLKNVLLGKGLGIPLKVGSIIPGPSFGKKRFAFAVPQAKWVDDARKIFGDVDLLDEKGQLVLAIKDVEMSTIRIYEAPPFSSRPCDWSYGGL